LSEETPLKIKEHETRGHLMPVSKAFAPLPSVAIVDILLNLTSF